MATIPASLLLANASTLLAWLCAYVPHEVLLALLFCVVVSLLVVVLLVIVTCVRCVSALYDCVTTTRSRKPQYRTQPSQQHTPRVNYGSPAPRHTFHTFQSSYQCPHCQGCLAIPPWSLRKPGLELQAPTLVTDRSPQCRASDTTPETKSFVSFEYSDTDIEPQITTPPRGPTPLGQPLPRRSPRPRKPRKFSFLAYTDSPPNADHYSTLFLFVWTKCYPPLFRSPLC